MTASPLAGLTIFEFGSNVAGPYAGSVLAMLGATVVKVERPEGDDARRWGPPFWNGTATLFHTMNRDKNFISANLKDPADRDAVRDRILSEADAVLQNMRPGAADKLGLGGKELTALKPDLIYCNMHAYGATGPMQDKPGYDSLMQAFGGLMSITGHPGNPPVRSGTSIIDMGSGLWAVIGILSALNERNRTGKGAIVDLSLYETCLGWMNFCALDAQVTGKDPIGHGSGVGMICPYQAFECADGFLMIAGGNDRLFSKLAELLARPEWASDPRYATNAARVENRKDICGKIEEVTRSRPRQHWQTILDEGGIPNAPIQTSSEMVAHPQTQALGILQDTGIEGKKLMGLPVSFDGVRPPLRNLAIADDDLSPIRAADYAEDDA